MLRIRNTPLWNLLICAALAAVIRPAAAAVIHVPADYTTIVAALSASTDGDTVLAAPGLYRERLVFPPGARTLASVYALTNDSAVIAQTILEPDPRNHPDTMAIVEVWGPGVDATLIGFTLRNGQGIYGGPRVSQHWMMGGATFQQNGRLALDHCVFHNNTADLGSALFAEWNGELDVTACSFFANTARLQCTIRSDSCRLHIARSDFHHNQSVYGMVIQAHVGSILFDSSRVDSNRNPGAWLAPVFLWDLDTAIVRYSNFRDNLIDTVIHGGGGMDVNSTHAWIEACTFARNEAYAGGGLLLAGGSRVIRCNFEENRSVFNPAAVACFSGPTIRFEDCRFVGNRSPWWSTITSLGSVSFENCAFLNNVSFAFDSGAAILAARDSLCISNCTFEGNTPAAISDRMIESPTILAENNWWGDPSGPYHSERNPSGLGDRIFGERTDFAPWLSQPPAAAEPPQPPLPHDPDLLSAYPNPFNGCVTLQFNAAALPREIRIFNLLGQEVAVLTALPQTRQAAWSPLRQPTGIYFAQLGPTTVKLLYLR